MRHLVLPDFGFVPRPLGARFVLVTQCFLSNLKDCMTMFFQTMKEDVQLEGQTTFSLVLVQS